MVSKRTTLTVIAVALVICGLVGDAPAHSQEFVAADPLRVAVIDVETAVAQSQIGQKAREELQKLRDERGEQAQAMQAEIADLRRRIAEGELSLSEARLEELRKQLEDKIIAFRRFQDDTNRELSSKQEAILTDINRRLMPIINEVGQELDLTLIFNKFQGALLYADNAIDITDMVVQRFNASMSESE